MLRPLHEMRRFPPRGHPKRRFKFIHHFPWQENSISIYSNIAKDNLFISVEKTRRFKIVLHLSCQNGAGVSLQFTHWTDWKNNDSQTIQMSEKLASLGIMEAQLRAPLKPIQDHSNMVPWGLRVALNWLFMMPRDIISLSDGCTADRCSFPIMAGWLKRKSDRSDLFLRRISEP